MKLLASLVVSATLLLASGAASDANAQISVGPRVSLELEGADLGLGAEARIPILQISPMMRLDIRPTFDWFFVGSGVTYFDISADALLAFTLANMPTIEPYALAGLGIWHVSVDTGFGDASSTDVGLNLGGGAKFLTGAIRPFAELRVSIVSGSAFVLTGGVLFTI